MEVRTRKRLNWIVMIAASATAGFAASRGSYGLAVINLMLAVWNIAMICDWL